MHSVWAGTPGVPLARCGCSVLNDRGTEAEETSPGALHHAILRRRVGLIAPSFCAQYEHPWHRALVHSLCSLAALLQAAAFMFKRWWVLVRLLASKYDSWGEFLTPLFWTWYARSGVRYFHMHSIKSPESRWFFHRQNVWEVDGKLNAAAAEQQRNGSSATEFSLSCTIKRRAVGFWQCTFSLHRGDSQKRGQAEKEGICFSRKQRACLLCLGCFESVQGSDWQTLTDRLTLAQRFLPALPGIWALKVLIFPPKPVHSQRINPSPPPPRSAPLRSPYILIQAVCFSPLVSRFQSGALIRCIFSGMCRVARTQPGELWVEMGRHAKHTAPSLESRPLR